VQCHLDVYLLNINQGEVIKKIKLQENMAVMCALNDDSVILGDEVTGSLHCMRISIEYVYENVHTSLLLNALTVEHTMRRNKELAIARTDGLYFCKTESSLKFTLMSERYVFKPDNYS
jgi:hypothetical protein